MIKEITPKDFFEKHSEEVTPVLIDVRSEEEYGEVHAVGAKNYPLCRLAPIEVGETLQLGQGDPIYFICRSGGRSLRAALLFKDLGFEQVYNVVGGTDEWLKEELPAE